MRFEWLGGLLAAAVLVGATTAAAQVPPPVAVILGPASSDAVSDGHCVLHVWPGSDARSSYTGWFHGGAVDGDKRGIKGYPRMYSDVLSTAAQRELLQDVDWAERRTTPGLNVVVHDSPPPPDDHLGRTTALIAGHPDCYDELLIHSVFVEGAAFSSKTVRLMVYAKRWRGVGGMPATYSAMSIEKVVLTDKDPAVIEKSLKDGFTSAIGQYLRDEHFLRR